MHSPSKIILVVFLSLAALSHGAEEPMPSDKMKEAVGKLNKAPASIGQSLRGLTDAAATKLKQISGSDRPAPGSCSRRRAAPAGRSTVHCRTRASRRPRSAGHQRRGGQAQCSVRQATGTASSARALRGSLQSVRSWLRNPSDLCRQSARMCRSSSWRSSALQSGKARVLADATAEAATSP